MKCQNICEKKSIFEQLAKRYEDQVTWALAYATTIRLYVRFLMKKNLEEIEYTVFVSHKF